MPMIGLATLLKRKRIEIEFTPFIVVFLASTVSALLFGEWLSARRSFQTLCMAGFCSYLIHYFTDTELAKLTRNSLFLLIAYYIYDFSFGIKSHVIIMQTWNTQFIAPGLLNNSNYTGMLAGGLAVYFYLNRNMYFLWLALFATALSFSKTAFLFLALCTPILFIKNKNLSTLFKIYCYFLFCIIATFPLILVSFENLGSEKLKLVVNAISGARYAIQLSFLELFKAFPLGVGYDQSHLKIFPYLEQGSSILSSSAYRPQYNDIGAHNTYLKLLVEFGLPGYFLYIIFIFLILKKCITANPRLATVFISLCTSQLLLEGLNDFIFYLYIALIFRSEQKLKG